MRRPVPVAVIVVGLLALSACSGSKSPSITVGSPSATAAATSPPATTAAPTPAPTASPTRTQLSAGRLSAWKACDGGFSCATLTVALDDAHPSLGTVALALTRHRATGSSRIGSLLVDPGGPGASAVDFLQGNYTTLFPQALRKRFDLVAFDPRGVGHTAPVRCLSTSQLDAYFHLDPVPDTPAEFAAFHAGNKKFAEGCQARSARVLPYVSTKIAAQDMDRVRRAVGDAKLSYLGYSYGTALGASYLDQFPTHVRAMVLDGAVDPRLSWDQFLAGQAGGFDIAFGAFLDNCQRTSCAFRKAVSGDLAKAYDALAAKVETHPLPGTGSRTVGPQEFLVGVESALYSRSSWSVLGDALARAEQGQGDTLMYLSDNLLERTSNGYANLIEAYNAVTCVDQPWPRTTAPYLALAKQVAKKYPRFGPMIALSGEPCAYWPVRPVDTPHAVSGAGSPPVVVIGTTRDPATPYSQAQGLAKQLAHGILLTYVGDGHTVYRSGAPSCITGPVNSYLISLTAPAAVTC